MKFSVIEVSCGEYGDNTRNLVNAIENGKRDIRTGHQFPVVKALNNVTPVNANNTAEVKDKNDANNIGEKFNETSKNGTIGFVIPGYATNDIPKESE